MYLFYLLDNIDLKKYVDVGYVKLTHQHQHTTSGYIIIAKTSYKLDNKVKATFFQTIHKKFILKSSVSVSII